MKQGSEQADGWGRAFWEGVGGAKALRREWVGVCSMYLTNYKRQGMPGEERREGGG